MFEFIIGDWLTLLWFSDTLGWLVTSFYSPHWLLFLHSPQLAPWRVCREQDKSQEGIVWWRGFVRCLSFISTYMSFLSDMEENTWQDQCSRYGSKLFFKNSVIHQMHSTPIYVASTMCWALWARGTQQQTKQIKPLSLPTSPLSGGSDKPTRCRMASAQKKKSSEKRAERVSRSGSNITLCIGHMNWISEIDEAKASLEKNY